jgi:glycosyltransferase involved in cell wall biosynthesis
MKRVSGQQVVVLCFSQAISSPIYDAIVEEYSQLGLNLQCFYFGEETRPLKLFAETLSLDTKLYPVKTKLEIFCSLIDFIRTCRKITPDAVIGFGQTATLLGLFSAMFSCKGRRSYFRQHTSSNRMGWGLKGYVYDKLSNLIAQSIIVSNRNTFNYLISKEKVKPEKISICEFGFNVDDFDSNMNQRSQIFKKKYKIPENVFVVGVVSRLTPIKGLEFSFSAFRSFVATYPNSILVLANAMDANTNHLNNVLKGIPEANIRVLDRETDMAGIYSIMDVLVHVPIDSEVESYGLVYVEAFLSGLPTIITLSGIALDIAINEGNCLVVGYKDSDSIYSALIRIREDEPLRLRLGESARNSVLHLSTEKMRSKFRQHLIGLLEIKGP